MRWTLQVVRAVALLLVAIAGIARTGITGEPLRQASSTRVVLNLVIVGEPAQVSIANGETIRVARTGWPVLGLVPTITDSGLDLRVVDMSKDAGTGSEVSREVAAVVLQKGKTVEVNADGAVIQAEWIDATPSLQGSNPSQPLAEPCTSCCVTCGDVKVCGCAVTMQCAACCCGTCCYPDGSPGSIAGACLGIKPRPAISVKRR